VMPSAVGAPGLRSPPASRSAAHRRGALLLAWLVGLLFVAALTTAQLFRQAGTPSWRTVWAEDGSVYFSQTRGIGNIFQGYAGYLQLHPRLLGLLAHQIPIGDVALYYAVAGALITSLAGLAVWHFSAQLIKSRVLRAVLALNVPLIPALTLEQTANGANSLWAVLFAGWWALLFHPRRARDIALASVVAFFAATSNGLALFYLPVALYLLWRRRDRPTAIVGGVFLLGIAIQVAVILTTTDTTPSGKSHLADLPGIYLVRAVGSALVGEHSLPEVWDSIGWGIAVLGGALFVMLVAFLAVRSCGAQRLFGLLSVGYSIVLYVAPVYERSTVGLRLFSDMPYHPIATRYTTLSVWLLTSGLFVMLSGSRLRNTTRQVVTGVIVVQFAVLAALGFRETMPRSKGPEWGPSVTIAKASCRTDPTKPVTLAVDPYTFDVVASCAELGLDTTPSPSPAPAPSG
jgi:hypothetical protein